MANLNAVDYKTVMNNIDNGIKGGGYKGNPFSRNGLRLEQIREKIENINDNEDGKKRLLFLLDSGQYEEFTNHITDEVTKGTWYPDISDAQKNAFAKWGKANDQPTQKAFKVANEVMKQVEGSDFSGAAKTLKDAVADKESDDAEVKESKARLRQVLSGTSDVLSDKKFVEAVIINNKELNREKDNALNKLSNDAALKEKFVLAYSDSEKFKQQEAEQEQEKKSEKFFEEYDKMVSWNDEKLAKLAPFLKEVKNKNGDPIKDKEEINELLNTKYKPEPAPNRDKIVEGLWKGLNPEEANAKANKLTDDKKAFEFAKEDVRDILKDKERGNERFSDSVKCLRGVKIPGTDQDFLGSPTKLEEAFGKDDARKIVNAYRASKPVATAPAAGGAAQPGQVQGFQAGQPALKNLAANSKEGKELIADVKDILNKGNGKPESIAKALVILQAESPAWLGEDKRKFLENTFGKEMGRNLWMARPQAGGMGGANGALGMNGAGNAGQNGLDPATQQHWARINQMAEIGLQQQLSNLGNTMTMFNSWHQMNGIGGNNLLGNLGNFGNPGFNFNPAAFNPWVVPERPIPQNRVKEIPLRPKQDQQPKQKPAVPEFMLRADEEKAPLRMAPAP